MGADFLVVHLSIDKGKEPDWQAGRRAAKTWTPPLGGSEGYLEGLSTELARDALQTAIDDLVLAWDGRHREAGQIEVAGKVVVLTGGMSWGDAPTELWDSFMRLIESGIHRILGFDP